MKNIFSASKLTKPKSPSEIIESEITDWYSRHTLPRHMSVLETKSHRGGLGNLDKRNHVPKECRLDADRQQETNLALDILKYQLSDRAAKQKHLENVRANLERRLKVAKAQGNRQLVHILQDEYRQLKNNV